MSSSQNSAPTLSKRHETRTFSKFGVDFTCLVIATTEPEWVSQALLDPEGKPTAAFEWVQTGGTIETSEVIMATVQDKDYCAQPRPVYLYSTADGPLLAIELQRDEHETTLLDPAGVFFDGKSKINLLPIFGVSRRLQLSNTAIKSRMPPVEVLLAAYPGFLIQNRMYKFQLRPVVPFSVTPELKNDGV